MNIVVADEEFELRCGHARLVHANRQTNGKIVGTDFYSKETPDIWSSIDSKSSSF